MKLFALSALTMIAFAANSLLNRAALAADHIGPASFATIRVLSGVVVLLGLLWITQHEIKVPKRPDLKAIFGLVAYILGFSFAYVSLDAGFGALVLFAGVQITMFAGAVINAEKIPIGRWVGMVVSLLGLAYLVWPNEAELIQPMALGLMVLASVGWGIYSLRGARVSEPLQATAWNFTYASPIIVGVAAYFIVDETSSMTGIWLAIASGAFTSGLAYALWYKVLPQLGSTTGALTQLSVPVIALIAGVSLLNEPLTMRGVVASALILGGIAFGIVRRRT